MKLADLYGEGEQAHILRPRYHTEKVYAWFQKRHSRGSQSIDDEGYWVSMNGRGEHRWKVPYGVRAVLDQRLIPAQITFRYPWYVTWVSPKTGKRLKKYFGSLPAAIRFIAEKAQYVDPKASIVSRHGYYIPAKLRGKFPRKGYYWCPCCMAPRKFRRQYHVTGDPVTIYAQRKEWSESKGVYEQVERKLALLSCTVCGITNRNHKFKANNQPWEVRRFKRGVTRARRRKRKKVRR